MRYRAPSKKLADFPGVCQSSRAYVSDHPRFHLRLDPGLLGMKRCLVCRRILDPLIPATRKVLIYDLQTKRRRVRRLSSHLAEERGRHLLDMMGLTWEAFLPLLHSPGHFSSIQEVRGSIVLQCEAEQVPWNKIFAHCRGPLTLANPSVGCGKRALRYAKDHFNDRDAFVIIERLNYGLEGLTVTCHPDLIMGIFDIAAQECWLNGAQQREFELMEQMGEGELVGYRS